MSFGNFLDVPLPAYSGAVSISVLPEKIFVGFSEGREVYAIKEHVFLIPKALKDNRIHVLTTDFEQDLFRAGNPDNPEEPVSRHSQILKDGGMVLCVGKLAPAALAKIRAAGLDHVAFPTAPAGDEEVIDAFRKRFGLTGETQRVPDRVHEDGNANHADLRLQIHRHDEVVDIKLKPKALRALFPADGMKAPLKQPKFLKHISHYALIAQGEQENPPGAVLEARNHSECFTGDVLGSERCDCGPQFRESLNRILKKGGLLMLHASEGRGLHSLALKMLCYKWHLENKIDTNESIERLGYQHDCRDYRTIAVFMRRLGFGEVRLITNNTRKIRGLIEAGIRVIGRASIIVGHCEENKFYIRTKAQNGHNFTDGDLPSTVFMRPAFKNLRAKITKRFASGKPATSASFATGSWLKNSLRKGRRRNMPNIN